MEAAMLARRSVFIALLAFVAIAVRRGAKMNPSASASPGPTERGLYVAYTLTVRLSLALGVIALELPDILPACGGDLDRGDARAAGGQCQHP